jgi:hypothetical protein
LGHGLGALTAIAGASFVGYVLGSFAYPQNFVILFLVGFFFMMVLWGGLALTREPPSITVKARVSLFAYLQQLPTLLRRDHNYARFLLSRTVAVLVVMTMLSLEQAALIKVNCGMVATHSTGSKARGQD